jgi:threonyl-tRNA synthetase
LKDNVIGYIDSQDRILDTQSVESREGLKEILFDNSKEALELIRHSTAHLMAQAINELYEGAKFFVGPVVEEGFYYDFSVNETVREEDLKRIEKKMKELIKRKFPIEKYSIQKDEALEKFSSDELKLAVLSKINDEMSQSINRGVLRIYVEAHMFQIQNFYITSN